MKKLITTLLCLGSTALFAQMVGVVQGRVIDTAGEGIPNVELKFTGIEVDPPFERTITCDEYGRFTLAGLKPILFDVYAKKEGYNDQIHRYKQGIGKQELDLTMMTMDEAYADALAKGLIEEEVIDPKEEAKDFYNLAVPLFKAEKFAEAMDMLSKSLEKDPELNHSLKLAAYCAVKTEKWADSLTYAERSLALEPEDLNMSKLALESARMVGDMVAETKFSEAVKEIEGVTPETLYAEAVDALNKNDDEVATKKLNEIITMKPDFGIAYFYLGHIKVREGEFEDAVKYLKQFLKNDPNHEKVEEAKDLIVTLSE